MTTQTTNRNMPLTRACAAFALIALGSIGSGFAAAAGTPQSQIAVSATVVRPPVPVVRILDVQIHAVSSPVRQETARTPSNAVQYVLVEY